VISADVEEGLVRLLGNPTTCPHGNPIPGTTPSTVAVTTLAKVAKGTRFTVVRIPEELEEHDGALHDLQSQHITPGRECTLVEHHDGAARLVVHNTTDQAATLDSFVSARLLVTQ
jgi:DtxR family Mn-dependent transcriptional regulator